MAEEKKPKIDLKSRLGKTPAPAPVAPVAAIPQAGGRPPGAGLGVPVGAAPSAAPSGGGLPGVPVGPPPGYAPASAPALDPNHPLAAAAGYRPAPSAAPAPQLQRIEVDELGVQQAAKSARKQGLVIGIVIALVLGGVGYVAGGAEEQGAGRAKSKADAKELATAVAKASVSLKTLGEKMEAGSNALLKDRKFPDTLSKDLGGIHVDFDGTQLAGRRFSGFPQDTTHELVSFITAVEGVNDRKAVIQRLLDRLAKPISEQLLIPAGQTKVSYVVAVDKDPSGNLAGFLSTLAAPITVTAQNIALPPKFTFANPGGSGNTELPRYSGGDIAKSPAAIYVVPKTFDTACPSAQNGQIAQLGAQIGDFIHTIKGESTAPAAGPDTVVDPKPGLVERADKLVDALNKI
jgi:hypothetical protein